ncbi:unnamed protein product, partial [Amoebophrya sp. A120]
CVEDRADFSVSPSYLAPDDVFNARCKGRGGPAGWHRQGADVGHADYGFGPERRGQDGR